MLKGDGGPIVAQKRRKRERERERRGEKEGNNRLIILFSLPIQLFNTDQADGI